MGHGSHWAQSSWPYSMPSSLKACGALHAESMLTIGLTLKDESDSLQVLQKQTEKIIGESESDLCDADFQPDLLSAARKRLG